MWTIRLKGKQIIAILVVSVMAAGVLYFTLPAIFYEKAQSLESSGESDKARYYYELVANVFPLSSQAGKALYFSAQNDIQREGNGIIYIFTNRVQSSGNSGSPEGDRLLRNALEKFKLVRERYPDSPWAKHALRELGKTYYSLGEYDEAMKYLKESLTASNMQSAESTEILAKIYLNQGQPENALELANQSLKDHPGYDPLMMMKLQGQSLLALERWDEARRVFMAIPLKAQELFNLHLRDESPQTIHSNIEYWERITQGYLQKLAALEESDHTSTLTGRVLLNGKGMENIQVSLVDKFLEGDNFGGFSDDRPQVLTGPGGEYSFPDLPPGRYSLGVGVRVEDIQGYSLSYQQEEIELIAGKTSYHDIRFSPVITLDSPLANTVVDKEIPFKWQPVAEAASYELFVGPVTRDENGKITGTYTTTLRSGITNNNLSINLEKEIAQNRFSGGIAYNTEGINPLSLFGVLYYGGEYTWGVNALDKDGNRITSSSGYGFFLKDKELPLFKIDKGPLTPADELLLARKYDEAVRSYLSTLEKDPDNAHALLVLARINHYGIKHNSSDHAAAAEYYERLSRIDNSPEIKKVLAENFYYLGEYAKAQKLYKSLPISMEEEWRTQYQLARIDLLMGHPQASLITLEKVVTMENGQYARNYPVALSLLLGKHEAAIAFAQQVDDGQSYLKLLQAYKDRGINPPSLYISEFSKGNYNKALKSLTTSQHDLFLKTLHLFITHPSYNRDELEIIQNSLKPGPLKDLLVKMLSL